MLSARNIQRRSILFDDYRLISEEDFVLEHKRTYVQPKDVLLTIVGTIGRVAVVPDGGQEFALQRSVAVLKPSSVVIPTYLAYALESPRVQQHFLDTAKGTAQKGVYLKALGEMELELAPIAEQTRIANQLDKLLARTKSCNDRLDAIPALLKRFRQAVLSAATSGALTEDLRAGAQAAYQHVSLGALISDGPQNGLYKHSSSYGTGTGILRIDMFYDGEVTGWGVMKRLKVDASELATYGLSVGDIVVNRVNSPPFVGKAALIRELAEPTVFESNMMRIRLDNKQVLPEYCIRFLSSPEGLLQLRRNVKHAVNQSSINQTDVKSVQVPLPCLAEQAEIVRRVEALFKIADRIEARYTAARTQAQRLSPLLLAKAFRGELVQQDPQDEAASVLLERIAAATPVKARTSRGRPRIKPEHQLPLPELKPADWASLPDGAWAAPADPDGFATMVGVVAVLRAWGKPVPEQEARLAALFCLQPRLFTAVLAVNEAEQWSRLIGDEARPLPAQVRSFQPGINGHWGRTIKGMRARGDLVEAGAGSDITWSLGAGVVSLETAGWPDGRAGFVVAYLRAHGTDSVLPLLETSAQEFADARAA